MNAWLADYVAAAIQVTLLSAVALLLHRLLGKCRTGTSVLTLATASVLTIVLTAAIRACGKKDPSTPAPLA